MYTASKKRARCGTVHAAVTTPKCWFLGTTIEIKSAPSSPSCLPTPCRFKHSHPREQGEPGWATGEWRVSASWPRAQSHPRSMVPKWTPFFTLFWAPFCVTASSRPCGSYRQILKGVETRSAMPVVWSTTRAFPLLLPLPTAALHHHGETKSQGWGAAS